LPEEEPEEEIDFGEWLDAPTAWTSVAGRTLPPSEIEPWSPTRHREQTGRYLALGSGGLFAGLVIDLIVRDTTADLESKVLPVLSGFVGLAFGYYFRNSPPKDSA
jgi:hypothetical protein